MELNTRVIMPSASDYVGIVRQLGPEVKRLFLDVEGSVAERLPKELSCGMILGWLRAKGYSWQEAFTMMDDYMRRLAGKTTVAPVPPPQETHVGNKRGIDFVKTFPPRHQFRIEMITCSVGCASFLRDCLERNKKHFDHVIVVTDDKDMESRAVAEEMGASTLVTNRFYRGGTRFNRGSAYNKALSLLRLNDWVVFVDVDVILDPEHRAKLEAYGLEDHVFYGCHRRNVIGEDQRRAFLAGEPHEALLESTNEWGFGYYQMFNINNPFLKVSREKGLVIYPDADDVNLSDHLFRTQFGEGHVMDDKGIWTWDDKHQKCLPWDCYHLGSSGAGKPSLTRHY